MTKGGDKDVTTRNTERALVDKPDTTISPPGLHDGGANNKREEIYETSRLRNIYFNTFTKQSCLSELSVPAPILRASTLCFRGLATSSVTFCRLLAAFVVAVVDNRLCLMSARGWGFQSLIWELFRLRCRANCDPIAPSSQLLSDTFRWETSKWFCFIKILKGFSDAKRIRTYFELKYGNWKFLVSHREFSTFIEREKSRTR